MSDHHHRSKFERKNRPFKGDSNRKTTRLQKGKTENTGPGPRPFIKNLGRDGDGKLARQLASKQKRDKKKQEVIEQRRHMSGGAYGPPKLVGLVSVSPYVDLRAARTMLLGACGVQDTQNKQGPISCSTMLGKRQLRMTIFEAPRDQVAVMDLAKVADVLLVVMSPNADKTDVGLDRLGDHFLACIKAQGVPTILGLIQGMEDVASKHQAFVKRQCTRYLHTQFPSEPKVMPLDKIEDTAQVFRYIDSQRVNEILWRDSRAYLLAEAANFTPGPDGQKGSLSVTGYLRGSRALTANHLVHLTGYGDFQLSHIESLPDPLAKQRRNRSRSNSAAEDKEGDMDDEGASEAVAQPANTTGPVVVSKADENRETLDSLLELDPLAHEQSLITDEELHQAQSIRNVSSMGDDDDDDDDEDGMFADGEMKEEKKEDKKKRKPKGMSDYQAVWEEAVADDPSANEDIEFEEPEEDTMTQPDLSHHTANMRKLERDEMEFPDEVETPLDIPAKDRFARYRGLASFHSSEWDPMESLPLEYSRIYQFESFEAAKRRVLQQEDDLVKRSLLPGKEQMGDDQDDDRSPYASAGVVLPSSYVTIHLINVPTSFAENIFSQVSKPLIVSGLFAYEHKVSVVHFQVRRSPDYDLPVKAKDPMMFHCGFRRFLSRPVYSEDSRATKYLCERFLQPGRFSVASIYSHIMFPPAPLLMFRPISGFEELALPSPLMTPSAELVATGHLMGANPMRINIKRIILTGYPVRVHKRHAVVRYMFFRPEDVRWFMPVKLRTKHGLVGEIRESMGTRGYMKCSFNDFIKNNDTICMHLYKRQYPPWDPNLFNY